MVQGTDGLLVIGDSYHYAATPLPFYDARADALMLEVCEAWWTPEVDSMVASSWTPESRVSTPESTSQGAVIAWLFLVQGWIPRGVDSQKNGPVAGEIARCAPQHTFRPEKEPENNGLAV